MHRPGFGEPKTHQELHLARDVKGNKRGFYKYINSKRKNRGNVSQLLSEAGPLETQDMGSVRC